MLLQRVQESGKRDFSVGWRYFSLTQVNSRRPRWKVWKTREKVAGNEAFRAAQAARCQGDEAFLRFHYALLAARHVDESDIDAPAVLREVAGQAGLDVERFKADLKATTLEALGRDHTEAVERYGAFGTPTFVIPAAAAAAYVRIRPAPEGEAALATFDEVIDAIGRPYLLEIKRATPPADALM